MKRLIVPSGLLVLVLAISGSICLFSVVLSRPKSRSSKENYVMVQEIKGKDGSIIRVSEKVDESEPSRAFKVIEKRLDNTKSWNMCGCDEITDGRVKISWIETKAFPPIFFVDGIDITVALSPLERTLLKERAKELVGTLKDRYKKEELERVKKAVKDLEGN